MTLIEEPVGLGDLLYAYAHARDSLMRFRDKRHSISTGLNAIEELRGGPLPRGPKAIAELRLRGMVDTRERRNQLMPTVSFDGVTGDLSNKANRAIRWNARAVYLAKKAFRRGMHWSDKIAVLIAPGMRASVSNNPCEGPVVNLSHNWKETVHDRGFAVVDGCGITKANRTQTQIISADESYRVETVEVENKKQLLALQGGGIVFRIGDQWHLVKCDPTILSSHTRVSADHTRAVWRKCARAARYKAERLRQTCTGKDRK